MSTVNEMIADLLQLQAEGHGDLEEGEHYVSIYAGN